MDEQSFLEISRNMLECMMSNSKKFALVKSKFKRQKSLEDIFSCVWDLKEAHEMLTLTLVKSEKSEHEANRLRTEGNIYYKKKNFEKALELFNLSIMAAPHPVLSGLPASYFETANEDDCYAYPQIDPARYGGVGKGESKALAMGYANRSALMFELGFFEKCLRDVNLALEYGYPEELRVKLYNRKEKCKETDRTDKALSGSDRESGHAAFSVNNDGDLSMGLKTISLNPEKQKEHQSLEKLLSLKVISPPKLDEPNPTIPSLSNAVEVNYTPTKGRGLVAVRNIRPGEVLGFERAYCATLRWHKLSTYCSSCLQFCLTPLPCPSCCKVIYCSELCRTRGLSEDHWIECSILPTLIVHKITNFDLAHRLLKNVSCSQLKDMMEQLKQEKHVCPEKLGCNSKGVYSSTSYQTIYHLCSCKERKFSEMFLKCQVSFAITKLLQQSGRYFLNSFGEAFIPTRKDFIVTGAVLLSHMVKERVNTFGVGDFQLEADIGSGVFPAMSLINHSCNPSVKHYNLGRELVFRAIKPIQAGQEVTDSYTGRFGSFEQRARQSCLEIYNIVCCCEACKYKWPVFAGLPRVYFKCLRCLQPVTCEVPVCDNCQLHFHSTDNKKGLSELFSKSMKLDTGLKKVDQICTRIQQNSESVTKEEFIFLCDTIELTHTYAAEPCQVMCIMSKMLDVFFACGM